MGALHTNINDAGKERETCYHGYKNQATGLFGNDSDLGPNNNIVAHPSSKSMSQSSCRSGFHSLRGYSRLHAC